jgi:CheY-like chemotaxis protein
MNEVSQSKRILLVEDLEEFYAPITRWLQEEGYQVTVATTLPVALSFIDTEHFHLAIVDIRLQDDDSRNEEGMTFLAEVEEHALQDVLPCIVLTVHASKENVLIATQQRQVARYIEKNPGYRTELLTAVHTLFDEKIGVNFDLLFDVGTKRLLPEIARDVNWATPEKPADDLLVLQVYDLFGRLFADAKRLYIAKLSPGLTGAAVVLARPTWPHGMGPAYVVKIGRRDKVQLEGQRYRDFVRPYLPPNTTTEVDVVFTRHLGALQFRFAESDFAPLKEFDEFYKRQPAEEIITSLRNLFHNTGRYWYDNPVRRYEDLARLYYDAFQLDEAKLHGRIHDILPDFTPEQPMLRLPYGPILNPVAWLAEHREECVMPVLHCITHGDLTGRNIMVSERGRCWLIDFYRTHDSHILRDFVILETDIKYRLMPVIADNAFARLERSLLASNRDETTGVTAVDLPPDSQKAAQVVQALHAIAYEFLRDRNGERSDTRKEYLVSLLMATLNVVRLQHIARERKEQALLSASLICAELDRLAGRENSQ